MKQSPASSIRDASPVATFATPLVPVANTVNPPSVIPESTVVPDPSASDKKKKGVSFDEQPLEVGTAAGAPTISTTMPNEETDDDEIMKPRPALPTFGSVQRNRMQPEVAQKVTEMPPERHEASSDHAIGGILKNSLEPLPPEVTSREAVEYISDESSEADVPAAPTTVDAEPPKDDPGLDPLKKVNNPQVRDFASTAPTKLDATQEVPENADVPAINLLPPTPGVEGGIHRGLGEEEDESLNTDSKARNSTEVRIPGSWADEDDDNEEPPAKVQTTAPVVPVAENASVGKDLETNDSAATKTVTPIAEPDMYASPQPLTDISEDSDDSAAFSDAAEDLSDLEDAGGFASLDAIVESPVVTPSPTEPRSTNRGLYFAQPPDSPSIATAITKNDDTAGTSGDWSQATAYWSQLSREKRQEIERNARPSPEPTPVKKPQPKKQQPAGTQGGLVVASKASRPATTSKQASSAQQEQPLRKTMRAQPGPAPAPAPSSGDDGVHMRKSMRAGGGGMASSLRGGPPPPRQAQQEYVEPRGTLQKKNIRPMSSTGLPSASAGAALQASRPKSASGQRGQESAYPTVSNKKAPQQRRSEPPQVSKRIQRELARADDSDSESSFKKRRRAGSGSTVDSQPGRYTMRRSMRASIDQRPTSPEPKRPTSPTTGGREKSSMRIRSMSPPRSFFGRKSTETAPPPSTTRTTMRGSSAPRDAPAKTMRTSAKPAATKPATSSRFKSRFAADSDDSDGDSRPTRSYRSRFADSDDDEPTPPANLTPVRGIPRRKGQNDGDSTSLSSEDELDSRKASRNREKMAVPLVPDPSDVEKAMAAARRNLGITGAGPAAPPAEIAPKDNKEGSALARGSMRGTSEPQKPESKPQDESEVNSPPEKKKRGFMGSLLRRNRSSTASVQQVEQGSVPPVPASPAVATPPRPPMTGQETPSGISPASPSGGKLIRRSSYQPVPKTDTSTSAGATSTDTKKTDTSTSAGATSDDTNITTPTFEKPSESWPLPPPVPEDEEKATSTSEPVRPRTSDGVNPEAVRLARTMRPDIGSRSRSGQPLSGRRVQIQAGEEGSEPGERDPKAVYSRRTGKKKKFGTLRRVLGIDD